MRRNAFQGYATPHAVEKTRIVRECVTQDFLADTFSHEAFLERAEHAMRLATKRRELIAFSVSKIPCRNAILISSLLGVRSEQELSPDIPAESVYLEVEPIDDDLEAARYPLIVTYAQPPYWSERGVHTFGGDDATNRRHLLPSYELLEIFSRDVTAAQRTTPTGVSMLHAIVGSARPRSKIAARLFVSRFLQSEDPQTPPQREAYEQALATAGYRFDKSFFREGIGRVAQDFALYTDHSGNDFRQFSGIGSLDILQGSFPSQVYNFAEYFPSRNPNVIPFRSKSERGR